MLSNVGSETTCSRLVLQLVAHCTTSLCSRRSCTKNLLIDFPKRRLIVSLPSLCHDITYVQICISEIGSSVSNSVQKPINIFSVHVEKMFFTNIWRSTHCRTFVVSFPHQPYNMQKSLHS